MNLTVNRAELLAALQIVGGAAAGRDVKPVLQNIKLVFHDAGYVVLSATDLEVGITLSLGEARLASCTLGEALLPPRVVQILKEIGDEKVTLSVSQDVLTVASASSEFELPTEDPQSFPGLPAPSQPGRLFSGAKIREAIKKTVWATSSVENTKFGATSGVLLEIADDITFVATDGRRLSCCGKRVPKAKVTCKGVVPVKTLAILDRLLAGFEGDVEVFMNENEAYFRTQYFKTQSATIYSRLVEGRFPDYRAAIPQSKSQTVELPVKEFLGAVRQASIMAERESQRVTFNFQPERLTLEASGPSSGRSRVEMPVSVQSPVEIAFDPRFILEGLKPLEAETVSLDLQAANSPAVFKSGDTYLYVVVPVVNAL